MYEIIKKLNYLLSPREKRNGVIMFMMMIFGALLEVVGVGAIPAFIGVISMPERLLEIHAVAYLYDALGLQSTQDMVMWAAFALIVIFTGKNLYLTFMAYVRARYTANRQVAISNRLFRAYLQSPYTFHLQRNTAELLRNTNTNSIGITGSVLLPILSLLMEGMVLVLIFVLLFAVEPLVTIGTFAILGSVTYVFWRATQKKITKYADEEQYHRWQSMQSVNQGLGGFKDARILGRESFFLESYQESMWFNAKASRFKALIGALPRLFLETISIIGLLGVTMVLMAQGRPMESVIPTLALLAVAVVRLMPSFQKIAGDIAALEWGERALSIVYDDLKELEDQERGNNSRLKNDDNPITLDREIVIDGLSYTYPGQSGYALDDVSLTIEKCTSVGFVGPSGAGKTTIVDVILGLLTPTSGKVLIDGVDIQERLASWQRKIGYIPQTIYLTDDTIRNNVAFGMHKAEISDDAVWAALDAAQLREFVESLPKGIDTKVGERGVRLSGGQRQRIGIARALYHNPEVLVMDEATSALDNRTERQFVDALEHLRGDHTVIIIAHRLTTVQHCDNLFMLTDGRLIASGSYDELMATNEDFRLMAGEDGSVQETESKAYVSPGVQ